MAIAATWVDLEIFTLSKPAKKKDKYYMILLICGILKTELIYKRELEPPPKKKQQQHTVTKRKDRRRMNQGSGIKTGTLLFYV